MRTPPPPNRPSLPASRRGHRLRALAATSLALSAALTPVAAHAETRDPGEIGHAIVFFGSFLLLFLGSLALAVWMIIARLRGAARGLNEIGRTDRFLLACGDFAQHVFRRSDPLRRAGAGSGLHSGAGLERVIRRQARWEA